MEAQVVEAIRAFLPALLAGAGARIGNQLADGLWSRIRSSVLGDRKAREAVTRLATNPSDERAAERLEDRLGLIFSRNPALADSVRQQLSIATYGPNSPVVFGDDSVIHYGDYVEVDLNWWERATGLTRVVVLTAILLFLAGFAIGGYQILSRFQANDVLTQAQGECVSQFPNPGFEQNDCMLRAEQQYQFGSPLFGRWVPVVGGLLFASLVLSIVAQLMHGAQDRRQRPMRR
jgi:hypothetical protein